MVHLQDIIIINAVVVYVAMHMLQHYVDIVSPRVEKDIM